MRALTVFAAIACGMIALAASPKDADRGRDAFEKRCTGCHTVDKIKLGPPLRGVYGRRAGKDPQFAYSDAVKNSPVIWDELSLARGYRERDPWQRYGLSPERSYGSSEHHRLPEADIRQVNWGIP
jgi:cytochrome c2